MEHYILVNPVSGNRKGLKFGIAIKKLLNKYGIKATLVVSEYSGHLTKISKDLSTKRICRFYSVGGDGTLNEVITGMIGTNSEVVVIPCGTGNDFIKSISKYMSMRKIVLSSINREATLTDILKINDGKYCINILNSGFDAMVAENVDHFRKVPFISGKMKYNLAIFYTLLANKNYKFKIRIDEKVMKQSFTLVAVANAKYYGGGICPCPDANVTDGILDICAIDSTRVRQKVVLLPRYKKGTHVELKQAHLLKGKTIHIVSTRKFPTSIDGEVFYSSKLSISVLPKAVKIVHIN